MISKKQIIIAQTLLSKCGLRAQKANIVLGFSDGRTEHVSGLEMDEAKDLIKWLREQSAVGSSQSAVGSRQPTERWQKANKMRRKILAMAHEMRWHLQLMDPSTLRQAQGPSGGKIDIRRVDSWCKKFGYLHKPLDDYTYEELPRLITQFEQGPYKHYMRNL